VGARDLHMGKGEKHWTSPKMFGIIGLGGIPIEVHEARRLLRQGHPGLSIPGELGFPQGRLVRLHLNGIQCEVWNSDAGDQEVRSPGRPLPSARTPPAALFLTAPSGSSSSRFVRVYPLASTPEGLRMAGGSPA
jgi:hypothetical protein